jgi:hypothetical protein
MMSPLVHGLIAWLFAFLVLKKTNDRRLAVIAGVAADLDGVFILFNMDLFTKYHHTFTHSYIFGIPIALTAMILGEEKIKVFFACLGAFTLHLLCDIIGSDWPIQPFYPFSHLSFSASPYLSITVIYGIISPAVFVLCIFIMLAIMYYKQASPMEFISEKVDKRFVSSFVYYFKYRCEICGKRALSYCGKCNRKLCGKHLTGVFNFRCKKCSNKK